MDTDVIIELPDFASDTQEFDLEAHELDATGSIADSAAWTSVANPLRTRV